MRLVNTAKTWFAVRVVMAVAVVPLHASIPRTLEISSGGPATLRSCETLGHVTAVADAAISRSYADASHGGLLRFACAVQGGPINDVRVASVSNGSASATFLYPDDAPLATSVVVRAGARVLTRAAGWDFENVRPLAVSYETRQGRIGTYGQTDLLWSD